MTLTIKIKILMAELEIDSNASLGRKIGKSRQNVYNMFKRKKGLQKLHDYLEEEVKILRG